MGALLDYVSSRLMKGRLVYSMCCLSGSALGPRIIGAGGLAFFGYREEFGFFLGSAESAFRESANSGWVKLLEDESVGGALNAMLEKFNEWLDYYTEGPGSKDPNAPLIGSWLVHDRDCLVVLGDMNLRLVDIPTPPRPDPASLWDIFVGFIWAILDSFGL